MASKSNRGRPPKDSVNVKFVHKAQQWVTTTVENAKQTQVWSMEKPNGQ